MRSPIFELKELWLYASLKYFPHLPVNTSITSPYSKTNESFIKLQRVLEKENIDADAYIGFHFSIAQQRPSANVLAREDKISQFKWQGGMGIV